MREDSIRRFLLALGVDGSTIVSSRGWVNSPCPMAPYAHGGGADVRPSFGVAISNNGRSAYYCFGCSPDGRMLNQLIHNMFMMSGRYPDEAARVFINEEIFEEDEIGSLDTPDLWTDEPPEPVDPLPGKVLKNYPLLQGATGYEARRCREYLEGRHIPVVIQNMFRVRYNQHNQSLIFPLTDRKGKIYLLRERNRKQKSIWTVTPELAGYPEMEFPRLKYVGAWFGMPYVDWRRPVLVTESEMDIMVLVALGIRGNVAGHRAGYNVLASATSSVSDAQIDSVSGAHRLVLAYDADSAGRHAHRRILSRIGSKSTVSVLDWSVVDRKDAGELESEEELRRVLEHEKIIT